MSIQEAQIQLQLAELRKKLVAAQEKQDKARGMVVIKQVEALYRSIGEEKKIPYPKWITEEYI